MTKLVRALGGSISIDSEEGLWSRFSVDFPFEDVPADISALFAGMKNGTIVLVSDEGELAEQVSDVFRHYNVRFAKFSNLKDSEAKVATQGTLWQDRSSVCLLQEDLYDRRTYESVSVLTKSVLLTFGPKYGVKKAHGHFRSLNQLLPSVLMRRIGDYVNTSSEQASHDVLQKCFPNSVPNVKASTFCDFRILVAEDNVVNQKVLARMLKRLGF